MPIGYRVGLELGAANPRLASLAGSVDHDLALVAFERKDYLTAAVAEERALGVGDDGHFYEILGKALYRLASCGPARAAFDRASALSPQGVSTLVDQAYLAAWTGDVSMARQKLDLARLIDPTDDGLREFPQEWLPDHLLPRGLTARPRTTQPDHLRGRCPSCRSSSLTSKRRRH